MPYTASQLTTFYTNANIGITPSAAESLLITAYAQQNANGVLTDAQTVNNVLVLSQDKTDVAVATYEFFTGATPSLAGLAFLVHGGGNANDLSSAYYTSFNKENRYYNFAINLAFGGPGATTFATNYGSLTFAQAVTAAYENIVGSANVGATAAANAIASIQLSLPYFQAVASQRAGSFNQDLATKAIMIGYILEEAIKADVGTYAKGVDGFMTSLATTNTAVTGDLLVNYPAVAAVTNVALTTGIDTIAGANLNISGTANGTGATFTAGDSIKVTGLQNTLSVSDLGAVATFAPTSLSGVTVSGVQTANFYGSAANAMVINTAGAQGWTGLTQLNVANTGTAETITAAATTNISATGTVGLMTVNGGNNVSATNPGGAVVVDNAAASAGNVTVTNSGAAVTVGALGSTPAGTVTVTDTAVGANVVSVDGGSSVAITVTGANALFGNPQVTVGAAVQTAGTVSVTATSAAAGGSVMGTIATKGGSTVTITENAGAATAGNTVTLGAVAVTGTAATTSVNVTQTAAAAAAATVAGVAGVVAVGATAGAPGVTAVAPVAGVAAVAAVAGNAGVNDGAVTITDKANASLTTAGTITTVTAANANGLTILDNALTTLNLSGGGAGVTITDSLTTPTVTSLTMNLAGYVDAGAFTDTNGEISTLNVVTSAGSLLGSIADAGLKTLNVSGSAGGLTLGAVPASLTALNVSGAASFNDSNAGVQGTGLAALGAALTITDTSSGKFTAALNSTKQTFTGSTGQDVITISDLADATKAITAGSATNNELILDGGAYALTSATAAKVTGFQTLGVTATVTGTIDLSVLDATASTLDIRGNSAGVTFTKVATGAAVNLATSTTAVSVTYVDANGANDTTNLSIGSATNAAVLTATALTLQDGNLVGVGTVNLVSNDAAFNSANVITTLTDNGLSKLNVSGTGGLTITTLNEATTQATSFTLTNTETNAAGVTIGTFTDANLGSLTFAGSNNSVISSLATAGAVLSMSNTGTGTATVTAFTDGALNSLTLSGNVALGANAAVASGAVGVTTGVVVSGSTDNAHVNLTLNGAAVGNTDTITLGNGNDYFTDKSTAGTVNVTVGTGFNLIDVSTGGNNATYAASVTLGAHTDTASLFDQVKVSVTGTEASGFSGSINGVVKGDVITFADANPVVLTTITAAQQAVINTDATLALAIGHAFGDLPATAHEAMAFTYGGNTYVIENVAADSAFTAGTDTVIQLIGTHTIATSAIAGSIAILT